MNVSAFALPCALCVAVCYSSTLQLSQLAVRREVLAGTGRAVAAVLNHTWHTACSLILLTDGATSHITIFKELDKLQFPGGMAVFEVALDSQDVNVTQMKFSQVIRHARQVRQLSRCVTVMLVSSDQEFLAAFAEWSLKGRLLVWSTRLLIITQQPLQELRTLMSTHWTFSMLNVILINLDMGQELRCGVYTHLPYSPKGARLVRLATWTNTQGLVSITRIPIFPNKFSNFYGSSVNVTALTYAPHWMTSGSGSNTQYAGMDYLLLKTIADALNFTIHVLPSASWKEVTDQVEARRSFVASIVYVVLPSRMEKYDFTQIFDFTPFCFATSKPELKPQWQSLYKPFTKDVWGANLVAIILVTVAFHMITHLDVSGEVRGRLGPGTVLQEVIATLLGQNLSGQLPRSSSNRLLIAAWLMFAFVISSAYRSILTASLTLPNIPSRPESVQELVPLIDRATIESYGVSHKKFLTQSESSVFRSLGELMVTGVDAIDGLKESLKNKYAHLGGAQYLELVIAKHFTQIDGSSQVYIGKETIVSSVAAWPIPHDAPYKPFLDRCIKAVTEAGIYEKWRRDTVRQEAIRANQRKFLKLQEQGLEASKDSVTYSNSRKALTLQHMLGLYAIFVIGLVIAGVAFLTEILIRKYSAPSKRCWC